jgi:hypothetical protein
MVSKCKDGLTAFDYGDLMFNASDDYRSKWMLSLDDFKDSSKKAHSIGSALEKKFDKFKIQLASESVWVDQVSHDAAWEKLEEHSLKGQVAELEMVVEDLNVHVLRRSPFPRDIPVH